MIATLVFLPGYPHQDSIAAPSSAQNSQIRALRQSHPTGGRRVHIGGSRPPGSASAVTLRDEVCASEAAASGRNFLTNMSQATFRRQVI